jgi:hypothetical protein
VTEWQSPSTTPGHDEITSNQMNAELDIVRNLNFLLLLEHQPQSAAASAVAGPDFCPCVFDEKWQHFYMLLVR